MAASRDAQGCSGMLRDAQGCSGMLRDAPASFDWSQHLRMNCAASRLPNPISPPNRIETDGQSGHATAINTWHAVAEPDPLPSNRNPASGLPGSATRDGPDVAEPDSPLQTETLSGSATRALRTRRPNGFRQPRQRSKR